MKRFLFILFLVFPLIADAATTTVVKSTAGVAAWICPPGVTSAIIRLWGGGGPGGGLTTDNTTCRGAGGAGGQFVTSNITVTPGSSYTYVVAGAVSGNSGTAGNGNTSTFNNPQVIAVGGVAGQSYQGGFQPGLGSTLGGVGDTVYRGGNGVAGGTAGTGGAGGGGAGTTGNGGDGSGNTGGTGTTLSGGNGGAGRTTAGNGNAGATAGGGGSGGYSTGSTTDRLGGNGAIGRAEIMYTNPPASALTDSFTGGTISTVKWNNNGGAKVVQANNELEITSGTTSGSNIGINSLVTYDLTNSAFSVHLVDAGNQSLASWDVYALDVGAVGDDSSNLLIYIQGGIVYSLGLDAGSSRSYNSSTMKYFRIRNDGTNNYWDYSANGVTWHNMYEENSYGVAGVSVLCKINNTVEASDTTAKFDDFNILPSGVAGQLIMINE